MPVYIVGYAPAAAADICHLSGTIAVQHFDRPIACWFCACLLSDSDNDDGALRTGHNHHAQVEPFALLAMIPLAAISFFGEIQARHMRKHMQIFASTI